MDDALRAVEARLRNAADQVAESADLVAGLYQSPEVPWDRDIEDELYRHPNPTTPQAWWERRIDQIDGVTLHHTLSDSPHATARSYCRAKGRPSIPYTFWISQTGEVLRCLDLTVGCWHDHCGHENTHLSIGLAGTLHRYPPAEVQLRATARLAAWVVRHPEMAVDVRRVVGHDEYARTQCPGWRSTASGYWRGRFYDLLEEELGDA